MALRRQFADQHAEFAPPSRGINLRDAQGDLKAGEAALMQNCIYDGGVVIRTGSSRLTSASLGSFRVRGGIKFYRAAATSQRLIAYSTKISSINDSGAESVLTSSMTSDKDTFFTPWSITDAVYIANNNDTLRVVDNTGSLSTVAGTNIPTARMVVPMRDRLLGITNNGIERTDARSATIWSSNSSWATFRPRTSGRFTAMHPYSFQGADAIVDAVLAFQANTYSLITGTNFGTDVTAASASTGEDSAIVLRDDRVGTSSPYSITTVPGIGVFWFTTDLNVYWLPFNAPTGRFVGDRIISNSTTLGINNTNLAVLDQVWMQYFDRKLILAIPTGGNTHPNIQFWMDVRSLIDNPERGPVWYGPMSGQTVGRAWVEGQAGDNKLMGAEGNSATGAFIYNLLQSNIYTDAVGTADTNVSMVYQPYFKTFGRSDRDKYLRSVQADANNFSGTTTVDVLALGGIVSSSLDLVATS